MTISAQIARHIREIHFGVNWTWSNLNDTLKDVDWKMATTEIYSCNTIAALTYHINYFVVAMLNVLEGNALDSHDSLSFNHPSINSESDWEKLKQKVFSDAEKFARLAEQFPDDKLSDIFWEEKYGNYYRNFHGIIEHSHYHLGQIAILKKILRQKEASQP